MASQVRCLGGVRDAVLIAEVQRFLLNMGKNPLHKKAPLQQVTDIHTRFASSGHTTQWQSAEELDFLPGSLDGMSHRGLRAGVRGARVESLVLDLPEVMKNAVDAAVNAHGEVEALPMNVALDRKMRKGQSANSTVQAALKKWLEGPDGKQWNQEREEIFGREEKWDLRLSLPETRSLPSA